MNIKGKPRGGPVQLAAHVQKAENESVRIVGIDGLAARDIEGALTEMDAQGAALSTDKTLYHGIISPEPGKDFAMTEADWDLTRKAFLKGMGFEGQPFIEIEHEKFGERRGATAAPAHHRRADRPRTQPGDPHRPQFPQA